MSSRERTKSWHNKERFKKRGKYWEADLITLEVAGGMDSLFHIPSRSRAAKLPIAGDAAQPTIDDTQYYEEIIEKIDRLTGEAGPADRNIDVDEPQPEALPEELSEVLPEKLTEALPEELSEALPKETSEVLPEELSEVLPEKLTEALPEELSEALPDEFPQKFPSSEKNKVDQLRENWLDLSGLWKAIKSAYEKKKDKDQTQLGSDIKKKTDLSKIFIVVLITISMGISGFSYHQRAQWELAFNNFQNSYSSLQSMYLVLQNRSSSLEGYYNELQDMYSSLRSEYSDLQNRYSSLERDKQSLQREYDEILRLEKVVVLEKDRTLNLTARGNSTLTYDTLFAGYIEVKFTSSEDIYFWVGSSLTQDLYYARYPSFPDTAFNGTFITPVCATVYLHVNNPNESKEATVTLTIKYVY